MTITSHAENNARFRNLPDPLNTDNNNEKSNVKYLTYEGIIETVGK